MKHLITALLLLVSYNVQAFKVQGGDQLADELEPCAYTFHAFPEYQVQLGHILFEQVDHNYVFQMLSHPVFRGEILLSVRREADTYFAEVATPSSPVWDAVRDGEGLGELHAFKIKKMLPNAMGERAADLWYGMILRTRFPLPNQAQVVDGGSYIFISRINHPYAGKPISACSTAPDAGTKPDLLVKIGEGIVDYVNAGSGSEKEIEERIYRLMDQLDGDLKARSWANICIFSFCMALLLMVIGVFLCGKLRRRSRVG